MIGKETTPRPGVLNVELIYPGHQFQITNTKAETKAAVIRPVQSDIARLLHTSQGLQELHGNGNHRILIATNFSRDIASWVAEQGNLRQDRGRCRSAQEGYQKIRSCQSASDIRWCEGAVDAQKGG